VPAAGDRGLIMSERRVAIQLVSTGGVYGAERVLLELAEYLRDRNWESHVVALEGDGAGALIERAKSAGLNGETFISSGRLGFGPMVLKLAQLLRRFPCAVVHTHGYKPDILLSIMGVPRRLPCIATCHNWISETTKLKFLEVLDRRALRRFDHVVAVSDDVTRKLIKSGLAGARVTRIDNGIAAPRAGHDARRELRAEFRIPADAKVLVQIGRLVECKRNDLLIEAAAALPDALNVHVLLVGDGDCRSALTDLARAREIEDRVHMCGYRIDIGEVLAASDFLVLTSEIEAMPIAMLEAMAMHCPIVATNVGAIPGVLADGEDAWIVPSIDAAAVTGALREALDKPAEARQRADRAYAKFVRLYSRDAMGAAYLRLYDLLWARRHWL